MNELTVKFSCGYSSDWNNGAMIVQVNHGGDKNGIPSIIDFDEYISEDEGVRAVLGAELNQNFIDGIILLAGNLQAELDRSSGKIVERISGRINEILDMYPVSDRVTVGESIIGILKNLKK